MKEELTNEKLREADDKEIDIQELLFKYLIHWPWFVGAVIVCLISAYIYLYVATPVYNISATALIKDDKKGGSSNNVAGLDELGLSGLITSSQSIDNEIEVLRSKTLVKNCLPSFLLIREHFLSFRLRILYLRRKMKKWVLLFKICDISQLPLASL